MFLGQGVGGAQGAALSAARPPTLDVIAGAPERKKPRLRHGMPPSTRLRTRRARSGADGAQSRVHGSQAGPESSAAEWMHARPTGRQMTPVVSVATQPGCYGHGVVVDAADAAEEAGEHADFGVISLRKRQMTSRWDDGGLSKRRLPAPVRRRRPPRPSPLAQGAAGDKVVIRVFHGVGEAVSGRRRPLCEDGGRMPAFSKGNNRVRLSIATRNRLTLWRLRKFRSGEQAVKQIPCRRSVVVCPAHRALVSLGESRPRAPMTSITFTTGS